MPPSAYGASLSWTDPHVVTNFQLKNDFRETKTNNFFVPFRFCSEKKIEKFLARNMFRVIFYFSNSFKSHIFYIWHLFRVFESKLFFEISVKRKNYRKKKKMLKTFFLKRFLGANFSMFASKVQCAIMTICSLFFFFKPVGRRNSDENCCQRWDLNRGPQVWEATAMPTSPKPLPQEKKVVTKTKILGFLA